MKAAIHEMRMLIAELLLGWAISIAPNKGSDSDRLKGFIFSYFKGIDKNDLPL